MEFKFDFEQVPSIIYMEFKSEKGRSFAVFENGTLIKNVSGITLTHNKNEYSLDLDRIIGFTQ